MKQLLSENEPTGKAKEVSEEINSRPGMVPNFFRTQAAVDPDWLEFNWNRDLDPPRLPEKWLFGL